jgi:hypothetical protein
VLVRDAVNAVMPDVTNAVRKVFTAGKPRHTGTPAQVTASPPPTLEAAAEITEF